MSALHDFTFDRNDTEVRTITLLATDITSDTISFDMAKDFESAPVITTVPTSALSGSDTVITLTIAVADWTGVPADRYIYALKGTTGGGVVTTYLRGEALVLDDAAEGA